jgi:hypothetical protein
VIFGTVPGAIALPYNWTAKLLPELQMFGMLLLAIGLLMGAASIVVHSRRGVLTTSTFNKVVAAAVALIAIGAIPVILGFAFNGTF